MKPVSLVLCLLLPGAAAAQPTLQNAQKQTASAASGLDAAFRAAAGAQREPAWIGWDVPVDGHPRMCCFDWHQGNDDDSLCGGCRLEDGGALPIRTQRHVVALEGLQRMMVLVRVEAGNVNRVRALSESCTIDAGGRVFHWLTEARPTDSLALLAGLMENGERHKVRDGALAAIALHAVPEADAVLERLLAATRPVELRKQAAFWLGNSRGRRGYEILKRAIPADPSDDFRAHGAFALSQSREPEAVDAMIGLARRDPSHHVRGQALFWLAQKAGARAAAAVAEAVRDDPDTQVKEKAVFALSQLPKDQGVPLLIQTARSNKNPAVRKKAIFWLGQSNDARALAFFEEVLSSPR
jgi:HEAT repeat protein